jgi:hypothetical protein
MLQAFHAYALARIPGTDVANAAGIPCGMIPLQRGIPCETLYLRRTVLFGEDKEIKLTIVEFNMSASSPPAP